MYIISHLAKIRSQLNVTLFTLPIIRIYFCKTGIDSSTDYRITVVTGDFDGAGTDSQVFLVMFGEHGESPQFKLTSMDQRDLFSSGAVSRFIIRTANLGDISHVRVSRDASGSKLGWFLKRIIVEDPSRPQCCYLFNCNDWITLSNPTDNNNSQVIRREVSHNQNGQYLNLSFSE